jgi:glycosyltransferase involved in cell wall biosynthesis
MARRRFAMKMVINAASAKMGGNLNYVTQVLRHLASMMKEAQECIVFLPPATADHVGPLPQNIRVMPVQAEEWSLLRRMVWEQITLRRFVKAEKADALFSTGSFGMFWCPVRQLLLVRNALYFSASYETQFLKRHGLGYRLAFWLRRLLILRSVRTADIVMTPTQAMMSALRSRVDVPPETGVVNSYGAPLQETERRGIERSDYAASQSVRREVRLLFVSLYSEHKNLGTLLKAVALLNRANPGRFVLDTTADPQWEGAQWTVTHAEDSALVGETEIHPRVNILGPLDRDRTRDLYRNADIFVFPSLVESFGFPLVEAMAWGLPIVAADTPVNREVCGEVAVYFNALSPEELASQVQRVSADRSLQEKLGTSGRRRAHDHFRWGDHVRTLLEGAFPFERQAAANRLAKESLAER